MAVRPHPNLLPQRERTPSPLGETVGVRAIRVFETSYEIHDLIWKTGSVSGSSLLLLHDELSHGIRPSSAG
jgi:hypothetical protein